MMSREHHRRRSPESTRRRRRERRDSREQLQSHPVSASTPRYEQSFSQPYQQPYQQSYQQGYQQSYQQPYQQPYQSPHQQPYQEPYPSQTPPANDHDDDRGFSSSFSSSPTSSSTSSSLLNISRTSKKFGLGMFFSGDNHKQRRRVRKKRSKILRFGNSSSSSVGSDLAYGRGYIHRRRSREFSPPSGQRPPRRDADPARPSPPKRAQTDEEIIELGRKFAEIARQQNAEDLRAAGRKRPSTFTGAVNALDKFRRTNSGNLNKGIGNSKPHRDSSSDDSDWESASSDDESGEDDSDNGLAYGSSHQLPSSSGGPSYLGASSHPAQTYSQGIPLNRKPSLVDPKLFGPINSLRGFVNTPCGFERVDRNAVIDARPHYEPSIAQGESAEGRPLQHVYPVPTSDPSRYDAGRGSIVSANRDSTPRSRPEPVPIQQPKPITPVHSKVFHSVDSSPESSKRPSLARITTPSSATGGIWSSDAAIGALLRAARNNDKNDAKSKPRRTDDEEYDPTLSSDAAIGALLKAARKGDQSRHRETRDVSPDVSSEIPHEKEPAITRDDGKEKRHREERKSELSRDSERGSRRRDEHRSDVDRIAKVEQDRDDSRYGQKVSRSESRREEGRADQSIAYAPKSDIPTPSRGSGFERSKGPIDPFQYQVADDAFPTPRFGTPTGPLPPVIMTVEREPDFSKLESHDPHERLSRKDSFERELQDKLKARKAVEQATVPVNKTDLAVAAAAAAAAIAKRQREHSPEQDTGSRGRSQVSSSSPRPKDPVIDDADRAYREERLARRIREQEERSRSSSPDRSVLDKWKDEKESTYTRQTPSPLPVDQPKPKNPYDGPNADVRIDNVLEHPSELSRFRVSESRRRSTTFPLFSARDPSAERERPILNLVRPTPAPSPSPEKQRIEETYASSSTTRTVTDPVPTAARDDVVSTVSASPSKAVSWGENQTKHYVVETPEREDDPYSGTKIITPSVTPRSRTGKKHNWGAIAAAISGVGVGIAASSVADSTVGADTAREHVETGDLPQQFKRRSSVQFDELYDDPPIPGPKPSSPRGSQMPKRFAEDPEFMANIAAGLEGSGFDPNIIIDDADFHRRDSPPGSNEPINPSVAATSRDISDERAAEEKEMSSDNPEALSRLSKKERRQQERASKQHISDRFVADVHNDPAPDTPRPVSDEDWAVPTRRLSKKEQKRRDKAAKSEILEDEVSRDSPSVQHESSPVIKGLADTPNKKKSKSRKAIVIQQGSIHDVQRDPQSAEHVESSSDASWDFEDDKSIWSAADEAGERKPRIHDRDMELESSSPELRRVIDDFAAARPEEWTSPISDRKKKKKLRRRSLAEGLTSSTVPASELRYESSYDYVESEVNPILADERHSPKGKQNVRDLTDVDLLPRSIDISESQANAGYEASEPIARNPFPSDWDLMKRNEKSQRDFFPSQQSVLAEDVAESSKNIADSSNDIRGEKTTASDEEWVDLPKKSKKKKRKSKGGATTHEESLSRSVSQSLPFADVLVGDMENTDLPPRPAPPSDIGFENEEKTAKREIPGEFPGEEETVNQGKLPGQERELTDAKDNRRSDTPSFFDRFRSSFGLIEGKEQSRIQDRGNDSFLDDAGALGASAGLMGTAIALANQKSSEKAIHTAPETGETKATEEHPPLTPQAEFIDPEIVEREIRPAIDPTYGDLLPLPPSRPSTPVPALDESIPPLPESRPGTPEDNRERRLLTEKSTHVRRRSENPLRVKTPSHSAIPIQFRLGQRTTPISPSILKQSPSASPVTTATPETSSAAKPRVRPMSWESAREFKPLLLVEKTSRGMVVMPISPEEDMPPSSIRDALPDDPESTPSHMFTRGDDLHDDHLTQETLGRPSDSPQLPPLRLVEEPESPTPRPDAVDAVSKNRSSYLLYSSPSNTQYSQDVDTPESSPTLRAAKRQAAFADFKENVPDLTDSDLLGGAAAALASDTLVANATVDDPVDSQEVFLDTKGSIFSDVLHLGESMALGETRDVNETDLKDVEPQEVIAVPEKKSKKGKKGKNKSREIASLAEASSLEAPVDPEIPVSSDAPEPSVKIDEKDDSAPVKLSKKDKKKKKKTQSQDLTTDERIAAETPLPDDDQGDDFFEAPAEQAVVEHVAEEAESEPLADAHVGVLAEVPDFSVVAPVEVAVEATTVAPVETVSESPVNASIEEAHFETPAEGPIEIPTEAHVETTAEAPAETSTEIPVEKARFEASVSAPSGEAPIDPVTQTAVDNSVEALVEDYAKTSLEAPIEAPVEALTKIPVDASIEAPAEASAEVIAEAPVEAPVETAAVEDLPLEEPVATTKKDKKKKRKSQVRELEAEQQPSLTIHESQTQEETVADEKVAGIEDPIPVVDDTTLEQEAAVPSAAFESPSTISKKSKKKKGKKSSPIEEEPATAPTLETTAPAESVSLDLDQEKPNTFENEIPKHDSDHAQVIPVEIEDVPLEPKEGTSEDAVQVSPADKESPVVTSKKTKKKKKGKSSQAAEPETSNAADTRTDAEITEEVQQSEAELRSSKEPGETSLMGEAISTEHIPTASTENLLNTPVEVVEPTPAALSDELNEISQPASETLQPPNDVVESTIAEVESESVPEEKKADTHENEGDVPVEAGELNSIPIEGHTTDTSQLPASKDENESETRQELQATDAAQVPLTENAVEDSHATAVRSFEAAEPSNAFLATVSDTQTPPPDQVAGNEPGKAVDSPEEPQGKKKGKKKKKKQQSVSDLSDIQDTATTVRQTEDVPEQTVKDSPPAELTEQAVEIFPTVNDEPAGSAQTEPAQTESAQTESQQVDPPAEDVQLDTATLSKKSKKGKKGKKTTLEPDIPAIEEVVSSPKPEEGTAVIERDIADSELVTSLQVEPSINDFQVESAISEEKETENVQNADFNAPEEVIGLQKEAEPSVAKGTDDIIRQELGSSPLSITETEIPVEREVDEAEPKVEAASSKKKSKKDKKKRGSAQLDSGSDNVKLEATESSSLQQDSNPALPLESPVPTDRSIEPATASTGPNVAQMVSRIESLVPSGEPESTKQQSPVPAKNEDKPDIPEPSLEKVSDVKDAPAVLEQVKEDDADTSPTSSSKESKKTKKKKRQSVQFAEPVEETTQIPAESTGGIVASDLTTEPEEISLDTSTTLAEPANLPSDMPRDSDQPRDEYAVQDPTGSRSVEFDTSSVPLPTDEEPSTYLPHSVSSRAQSEDPILKQGKDRDAADVSQTIDPLRQDVGIPVDTHLQGDTDTQQQTEGQTQIARLDMTSDAPVKPDDLVSAEDNAPAEAIAAAEDPIPATVEDESSSVAKKSKKEKKKKRKEKSQESQEVVPGSPALAASLGEGVPVEQSQESTSAIPPQEAEAGQIELVGSGEQVAEHIAEQPAVEEVAPDDTLLDATTGKSKKDDEIPEVEPAVSSDATPKSTVDSEAQKAPQPTSRFLPAFSFSSFRSFGRSKENKVDTSQSDLDDTISGTFEESVKPPANEQRSLSQEPPITSPILDDPSQPSQDVQISEPATLQPESPTTPITEPMINDLDIGEELAPLLTSELDQSLETKASEEQSSESTASRKSKKDKKKRDSQPVTDEPDTAKNAGTEVTSNVQGPTVIEETTTEALLETTEDQAVGDHTQEFGSHQEAELSVAPSTPVEAERSIDLPKSAESPSAQLSLDDKAIPEDIESTPTKKSKKDKKKKKQENSQEDELPLPEPEQSAENPAAIHASEGTESVPTEESKDDATTSSTSAKKTKKDKKKKKLASVQDEDAPPETSVEPTAELVPEPMTETVAEPAQPSLDSPDQNDASLSIEPDNSQVDALPKSEDTLQVEEAVNADDTSVPAPNKESEMDDTKERPVSLSDKEAASDSQVEPDQAGPAKSGPDDSSLLTELENSPAGELPKVTEELPKTEEEPKAEEPFIAEGLSKIEEPSEAVEELLKTEEQPRTEELSEVVEVLPKTEELPKADGTEEASASTPTKKSKKDKKKKKKAASREEEAPLDSRTLADPVSGATEPSEAITTVSTEAGEGKVADPHSVSEDTVTGQAKTVPQDDSTSKTEDASPDEIVVKGVNETNDGDATRSEVVSLDDGALNDDSAPKEEGDSKEKTQLQSKPISDSLPSDDSPTKSEENEKEKSGSSWEDDLLQEFAEESAEAPAVDLTGPTEKEISVQEPTSVESVTDTASVKKSKRDKKKKKQSSHLAEELAEEKATEDPIRKVVADLGQTTEDQIQAPTPELNDEGLAVPTTPTKKGKKDKKKKDTFQADELVEEQPTQNSSTPATGDVASPVVNEPSESEPAVPEPPTSEPLTSQISNDDGLIQPISKKKSKKDKKKKKQMDSVEDDAPEEVLVEGNAPKADSPQEQLVQDDLPQEDISKEELSTEAPPKEGASQEELAKEELLTEELPKELLQEELALEKASEIAPETLSLGEPAQITLPQVETEATSEPVTTEKLPNDETIKVDIPPNDDSPLATPTKKSKKDKKKKKQASGLEDEAIPQEEPKQLEENQPLPAGETALEVGLSLEGEASEVIAPNDVPENLADPAPTKKSKKDKKKKKQALLEADLAQEPVETTVDPMLPSAPDSIEQNKVAVSLPDALAETEATELSPTKSKKDENEEKTTSWEEEGSLQLPPSLEPDLSRDASAEPSQSEGVAESASSKKSKKNKKKKRASEVEPQPEAETGANTDSAAGLAEVAEPAEVNSSTLPTEQLSIHVIEDQDSSPREPTALSQDEAVKPPDNLGAGARSTEPLSTEEITPSAKLDDVGESNAESKISETSANAVPEDATPQLSSHDQQPIEEEPLDGTTPETGRETGIDNFMPLQEPETGPPETGQAEGATPKADDGINTTPSKKSKKDKKKKKRASQVSWETGPEAEIEDIPEKQQSEQAFDKPMTGEPTEMGSSDKAVGDPFFEFASGEKSEDMEKRQSQVEGEPEPDSAKTVEELKPINPTEQEQHNMLLNHQSLAEDTETSLKDSTDLDDTFLETTSNKNSIKKQQKASQLAGDAKPATTVTPESAISPVEQNLTDKSADLVDALLIEPPEITPGQEANTEEVFPEGVSTNLPKKDKRRAKKQSAVETPVSETIIKQPAENSRPINDVIVGQIEPAATAIPMPVEDGSFIPENPSIPDENDTVGELSRDFPAKEIQSPLGQAQDASESSQSTVHGTTIPDTSEDTQPPHGNYPVLPNELEEARDQVSLKELAEEQVEVETDVQKDTTTDTYQDPSQELSDLSTKKSKKGEKKAKKTQVLDVSDADSNERSGTILQSWDWSNIDNVTKPEIPVPKETTASEDLSNFELPRTTEPVDTIQTTGQLEQKEGSSNDNTDSNQLEYGESELLTQPEPEPESPTAQKKSKKDKKKKKGANQSESGIASAPGTDESHDTVLSDPTIRGAEALEPQDKGTASEKESKKDKKRAKSISLEETPQSSLIIAHASQEPAALEQPTLDEIPQVKNQNAEARSLPGAEQPIPLQEQSSVAQDPLSEKPTSIPDITEEGQLPASDSRPRTPSMSRQVPTTVDMSPAQQSSHIEHDRPFDQSTQPDKKPRTHLDENDAMVPEPLSAMTEFFAPLQSESDSRVPDAMDVNVSEGSAQPKEKAMIPDPMPQDRLSTHFESSPLNIDELQTTWNQKEQQGPDPSLGGDETIPRESPTSKPDKKKRQSQAGEHQTIETIAVIDSGAEGVSEKAEKVDESKTAKGKEKSKSIDKRTSKTDDIFDDPAPLESSERKVLEGSRLETDSSNLGTGPIIEAKEQSNEAAQEMTGAVAGQEILEPTQHHHLGAGDTTIESPIRGKGSTPELLIPRTPDAVEARSQIKGISTTGRQDSWDDLDTSEPLEDHDVSLHTGARDVPKELFIPSLPPPRTPSALDYSRSLPPVEEETHEDLEKESRSVLKDKPRIGWEANRDSGLVTDSPNPQRRGLGTEDDASQRDSGVHMTLGPSEETADSQERRTRTAQSPPDQGSSSQTPQTRERRSRRSLFDNETPKLGTPTQTRGWDRGATPEKPAEEEPVKRSTTSPTRTPQQQTLRSVSDNVSNDTRPGTTTTPQPESVARRSASAASNTSISRLRTPELFKNRPDSPGSHSVRSVHSIRSLRSGAMTPPLRRVDRRMSGDLRSLSHTPSLPISLSISKDGPARTKDTNTGDVSDRHAHGLQHNITPIANEGRVRSKDMTDVYDGYGEGRIGSPRSPTRPPSMRRRQSMQVLELEARVEQLLSENRALADARAHAEQNLSQRNTSAITDRDAEIESLKASLKWLQNEVTRLTEVNEGLQSANSLLALQHNEKYTRLESQHTTAARELEEHRGARDQFTQTLQAKDAEIQELRNQLEATKDQIREMKKQILAAKPPDADFLRLKDEDHFDHRCQQLCSHVQQWVLRFSKFSDMRACRLTSEINDEKIIDRLDNTILDGSDVDDYLSDRVARRDIFVSMTMNMIWEFVFTRYLFGMDREQRQKLKSLEKTLTDVGPPHAVRQWRAITLTLLSKRPAFGDQRNQDTEAVVQAILQTLSMILPPPTNLEAQIQSQLRRVMREAVDLSIEMRTQRAEYMMLPPLQPEYDANGELTQTVSFNAALMNERSGDSSTSNEAYEAKGSIVRCVLFPLVVKKGDDNGVGDDEIVISPAQVLVAKVRRSTIRMVTPSSENGGVPLSRGTTPSALGGSTVSVTMKDAPLTPPGYV